MADLRPITEDEISAFRQTLFMGFGEEYSADGEERFRRVMPLERTLGAFDRDHLVGTLGDFGLQLTVPGGKQCAMGGTTMVTVLSTHRRQGLLRALMTEHLNIVHGRGDAFAGLWASEAAIYGRFGFGVATEVHEISCDARGIGLPPMPNGHWVEFVSADDLVETIQPFWSAQSRTRAGHIDRSTERWQNIAEAGAKPDGGATSARHVVVRRPAEGDSSGGDIVAYACYRQRQKWERGVSRGSVAVEWLMAADIEAHLAVWSFLTNIDLFPHVVQEIAPVDDPLILLAGDPRRIQRNIGDALYLRVLDVPAALEARTWEADGTLVLGISDAMGFTDGVFRLAVEDGTAAVEETKDAPQVIMDIREFGSIYLGGFGAAALGRAGQIAGDEAAIQLADRLFRTHQPPFCSEDF